MLKNLPTMKKLFSLLFIAGSLGVQAQCYTAGTNVLNAGVGFGYSVHYYNGSSSSPVLSASFEHGIKPLGPGMFGIGGVVSYQGSRWDYTDGFGDTWHEKWQTLYIGARGTWHPDVLVGDNYDVYGALQLGYYHYGYSYTATGPYINNYNYDNPINSRVGLGLVVGGRYFFTSNIGAFLELGYDISYSKIGLSVKF